MTRASQSGGEPVDRVRTHGAALHRLAAMLTADTQAATRLTGRALAAAEPDEEIDLDRLKGDLVRDHLQSVPRRPEGLLSSSGDAADVLRQLRPRARAVSALRLVEGWDADRTAAAAGVSRRRVEALVPAVPGLDLALTGLADQHSLAGGELEAALRAADSGERTSTGDRPRRRTSLLAALLGLALVAGYLLVEDRVERDDGSDDPVEGTGLVAGIGEVDLTQAGWRLDDKGVPPGAVTGLYLRETVFLDDGRRSATVSLPPPPVYSYAAFGVLWCDMPPAQDDNLVVPSGTLTVGGDRIDLPCAGRDGSPPVTRVVALPPGGEGVLEVSGDLPSDGGATLAVYQEGDNPVVPAPVDGQAEPPPADPGALVLDLSDPRPSVVQGWRTAQSVSIGHASTIRVWAGRTGSIEVRVDGVQATDDGDLTAMLALLTAQDGDAPMPEDRDPVDWSSQQADIRDGRWLVPVPDLMRTFQLPEQVLPPPGERRTVSVEVLTENVEDHLQVVIDGDAQAVEVDTAPVAALPDPTAPQFVLGHRLVGQWMVPSDGHLRELQLGDPAVLPDETVILMVQDPGSSTPWNSWGEGVVTRGDDAAPALFHTDLEMALSQLPHSQFAVLPAGPGPVSVAAPSAQDRPPTAVLAYAPVPPERFDFAGAAVPPDSWRIGADAPVGSSAAAHLEGAQTVAVAGPGDVVDGQIRLTVSPSREVALQVTTEGQGRMRILVGGGPVDGLFSTDGWWSSWTDKPVTSLVPLFYSPRQEFTLTIDVEDYENFTIEVLSR